MVIRRTQKPKAKNASRARKGASEDPTLWEDLAAIGRKIPDDVLKRLPTDLGRNLDHYMYGKPKTD